ncbi:MAG: pitrilysin family protein [Candidatus Eisenbacteria bacterium]
MPCLSPRALLQEGTVAVSLGVVMTEGILHRDVLNGGMTVVAEEVPGVRSVSVGVWVRSGSRNEKAEQGGLSHFIEHMSFKGTSSRSAFEIARSLESVGGQLDAFASREFTCYLARVFDEHLPLAIDVLSDIVCRSLFDRDEIEKEKRVILDEIRTLEDTPDDQIHEVFSQVIWREHSLGRSILGSKETVEAFNRGLVAGFHGTNYGLSNTIVSVAGKFDYPELLRLLSRSFSLPEKTTLEDGGPVPGYGRDTVVSERDLAQEYICVGSRGVSYNDEARFPVIVLNVALGGGMSSRLFQRIREELGLAYSVYTYADFMKDSGLFCSFMGVDPGRTIQALEAMLAEFEKARDSGLDSDEIESAKAQLKGSLFLGMESMSNRMTRLAKAEIYCGRYVSLDEVASKIDGVTPEDVLKAGELVLSPRNLSLVATGPCPEKDLSGVMRAV